MKMYLRLLIIGFLGILAACEKDDFVLNDNPPQIPGDTKDSLGLVLNVLSSKQAAGFLYDSLNITAYPNAMKLVPEFVVMAHTSEEGIVESQFLSNPKLESRFALLAEFNDFRSAKVYYETFNKIPENISFTQFAEVKPYQVWLVMTNAGKPGKMVVASSSTSRVKGSTRVEILFAANYLKSN